MKWASRVWLLCGLAFATALGCAPADDGSAAADVEPADAEQPSPDADAEQSGSDSDGADGASPNSMGDAAGDAMGELDAPPPEPVDWINPLIATGGIGFSVGSGLPGPGLPHALSKPGPDSTGPNGDFPAYHCGGYHYDDDTIYGFSHTHLYGVGIPEYGNLLLMPTRGPLARDTGRAEHYASMFRKETERARAEKYEVELDGPRVHAELTATMRGAHHRWTWLKSDSESSRAADDDTPVVVLDLAHTVPSGEVVDSELTVAANGASFSGWLHQKNSFSGRYGGIRIYFAGAFREPPTDWAAWAGDALATQAPPVAGPSTGALFAFADAADGVPVEAQVAISFVSVAGAKANLAAELPAFDFEATQQAARQAWADELDRVRFDGGTDEQRAIMATAVYHALQMPNVFEDVTGEYLGFDGQVHVSDGFTYYTDFSMWDTYRTQHPLLALIAPERAGDMMRSLLAMAEQGGHLPKWPQGAGYTGAMNGTPADIVIADAALKGVSGFDANAALEYMLLTANAPAEAGAEGRPGIQGYLERGWVATEEAGGSVAITLEYSHADFAIANLADHLGRADVADAFWARLGGYQGLWDKETRFLRGRRLDGTWAELKPTQWQDFYEEGNAWQYTWMAPWDGAGLVDMFGGAEPFVDKLTELLERGRTEVEYIQEHGLTVLEALLPLKYYWHSNEPSIHSAYLFLFAGRPDLTQMWVRWIAEALYANRADGLAGNDDAGTLSAWYAFSAMGFYPIAGSATYLIGSPIFERVELQVGGGTFSILAPGASSERRFVAGVTLNGEPLDAPWFSHKSIVAGGSLVFDLSETPTDWGALPQR